MAAVNAFLFDIGNVLVGFDFDPALEALKQNCGQSIETCRPQIEALKNEYESGRIGRRKFITDTICILEYRGTEATFETIWQEIFFPNEPMLRLVRKLTGRLPLYHLSNTSDLHLDHLRAAYPVFECFDGGTYSYLVGAMKPERAIYERAISDLGLVPAATVFIDDLPPNIDAAKQFGFLAFQYRIDHHDEFLHWLGGLELPPGVLE